jgi:hypothetical protein
LNAIDGSFASAFAALLLRITFDVFDLKPFFVFLLWLEIYWCRFGSRDDVATRSRLQQQRHLQPWWTPAFPLPFLLFVLRGDGEELTGKREHSAAAGAAGSGSPDVSSARRRYHWTGTDDCCVLARGPQSV